MAKQHRSEPRLTIQVPAELERRIRAQAKREDRSASALIRRAVVAYLEATERP
jgi:predicted transcriptional regulator